MNIARFNKYLISLLLVLPTIAQANVGKVLYAKGPVTVERETSISLRKGDLLEEGDIVITGNRARAQLLMIDGARIAVRANTRLELEIYQLDGPRASAIASGVAEGEVSMNLLKGGLRTITGAIGKADHDDYTLRTPVATLGIRGTEHETRHCAGDCGDAADGTY